MVFLVGAGVEPLPPSWFTFLSDDFSLTLSQTKTQNYSLFWVFASEP